MEKCNDTLQDADVLETHNIHKINTKCKEIN